MELSRSPTEPDAETERERRDHLRWADIYQSQKKWSRATEHFQRALRLGDEASIRVQLGHCLKQLDRFEDALVEYLTAARPPAESRDAMLHAAHMLKNIGFPREALELLGLLAEAEPNGEHRTVIQEITARYRAGSVFCDEVDHREGRVGPPYDIARLTCKYIAVREGGLFATSGRAEIIFEAADLPPFGFTFLEMSAPTRFEIFCDYGQGLQPYGHFRTKRETCDRLVFCPPDYDQIVRLSIRPTNEPGPFKLAFCPNLKKTLAERAKAYLSQAKSGRLAKAPEPTYCYLAFAHAMRNHLSDFSRFIDYRQTDLLSEPFYPNRQFDTYRTSTRHGFGILVAMTAQSMPFVDELVRSFTAQGNLAFHVVFILDGGLGDDDAALIADQVAAQGFTQAEIVRKAGAINGEVLNWHASRVKGDWVFVMPGHDKLNCHAIDMLLSVVSDVDDRARLIYTDEVVIDERSQLVATLCKSAYNEVLITEFDDVGNAACLRKDALLNAPFAAMASLDARHDHTLAFLETIEPDQVVHVPYPLYCRRHSADAAPSDLVLERIRRRGLPLDEVFPSARRARRAPGGAPLVSIIIPNKNAPELLKTCLNGARTNNSYPNTEIIVVDNQSDDPQTEDLYQRHLGDVGFQVVRDNNEFNFSRLINLGLGRATGDYVLLLNNDIEFPNQGWLEEMVGCMAYRQTAVVGPMLLYPNGTIQHAGVIVGLGHGAGHWFVGEDPSTLPPSHRLNFRQNLSAVTGACMLIDRHWFDVVGGFDETAFAVAYNDVDFCLRVQKAGGRVVFTPFARMIHHESVSRGSDEALRNYDRWLREFQAFRAKFDIEAFDDFAFSPWFDRMSQLPLIQPWKRPKPYR